MADLTLDALDARLQLLLPPEYRDTLDQVEPTPMRSAGLAYDAAGRVAWDRIWGSFCDLAMAGGPPHKGLLLEPAPDRTVLAESARYRAVVEEICRGIGMVTGLRAEASSAPGWIAVTCPDETAAAWLLRAVTMENVAVRAEAEVLLLPASPAFRLDKEIKNVVTVIAKTWHYWDAHLSFTQQFAIGRFFAEGRRTAPFIEPAHSPDRLRPAGEVVAYYDIGRRLGHAAGFAVSPHQYVGWIGLECPSVRAGVWIMRALLCDQVASRREATTLFVPVNAAGDAGGARVERALRRVLALARARAIVEIAGPGAA